MQHVRICWLFTILVNERSVTVMCGRCRSFSSPTLKQKAMSVYLLLKVCIRGSSTRPSNECALSLPPFDSCGEKAKSHVHYKICVMKCSKARFIILSRNNSKIISLQNGKSLPMHPQTLTYDLSFTFYDPLIHLKLSQKPHRSCSIWVTYH